MYQYSGSGGGRGPANDSGRGGDARRRGYHDEAGAYPDGRAFTAASAAISFPHAQQSQYMYVPAGYADYASQQAAYGVAPQYSATPGMAYITQNSHYSRSVPAYIPYVAPTNYMPAPPAVQEKPPGGVAAAASAAASSRLRAGASPFSGGNDSPPSLKAAPATALATAPAAAPKVSSEFKEDATEAAIGAKVMHEKTEAEAVPTSKQNVEPPSPRSPIEIPQDFICPIRDCVFSDPVVSCDGHTYERDGIIEWLSHHNTSPMTNDKIETTDLYPNWTLKKVIHKWMSTTMSQAVYSEYMTDLYWVQYLLKQKDFDVNRGDENQVTPLSFLCFASKPGTKEIIEMLLMHPAVDINKPDIHGSTPLICASSMNNLDAVRLLLAKSACHVNQQDNTTKATALLVAVWEGHTETVRAIMGRHDVDVTLADLHGRTPLATASSEEIKAIISSKPGKPPMGVAAMKGSATNASTTSASAVKNATLEAPLLKSKYATSESASSAAPSSALAATKESGRERGPSSPRPISTPATPAQDPAPSAAAPAFSWSTPAANAPLSTGHSAPAAKPSSVQQKPKDMLAAALAAVSSGARTGPSTPATSSAAVAAAASAKAGTAGKTEQSADLQTILKVPPVKGVSASASAYVSSPAPAAAAKAEGKAPAPVASTPSPLAATRPAPSPAGRSAAPVSPLSASKDPYKEGRALISAAKRGDATTVTTLLEGGADANFKDGHDEDHSAMYWAGVKGKTAILSILLRFGADVNLGNRKGNTALIMSSLFNHIDTVDMLLRTPGVDPNLANNDGWSPLMLAADKGNNEIITNILARNPGKISLNFTRNGGNTSLAQAAIGGYHDTVKLLIGIRGIEVNRFNKAEFTALHLAVEKGHTKVVQVLLSDPSVDKTKANKLGKTPLQTAQDKGFSAIAELLRR